MFLNGRRGLVTDWVRSIFASVYAGCHAVTDSGALFSWVFGAKLASGWVFGYGLLDSIFFNVYAGCYAVTHSPTLL